jgi:hypothetical protein
MNRRNFIYTSGLTAGVLAITDRVMACAAKIDPLARIGLTTVVFRNRFRSTTTTEPFDELKLKDIPSYFKGRFGIANLEFWSKHFESLEPSYLNNLRTVITDNGRMRI